MNQPRPQPTPTPWSRQRLLTMVAITATLLLLALTTAGYYSLRILTDQTSTHRATTVGGSGIGRRDAIAAAPMLSVDAAAMYPATPTAQVAAALSIPPARGVGPQGVPSGFPHTAAGAIAQLGALGTAVFSTMSMQVVTSIYRSWAMPGGAGASAWALTSDVEQFLSGAQATSTMPAGITITAIPSGAILKGTDGPDWVLACVLWQISETGGQPVSLGYGHCERMQWVPDPAVVAGGRWEIAPGTPPAPAPDTWPGTAIAEKAGWKTWQTPPAGGVR